MDEYNTTKLAEQIIDEGRYEVLDADHYKIGGFKQLDADLDAGIIKGMKDVPLEYESVSPSWCGGNNSNNYFEAAELLHEISLREKNIDGHVILSELVRAIDCRLAEFLFYVGLYPEKNWVKQDVQMSLSKKLHVAKELLPSDYLPKTLLHIVKDLRNEMEHQYQEPEKKALRVVFK